MKRSSIRALAGAALALFVVLLAASCAEYSIERDGKDAGEALCDLKNADNQDEAQQALADAQQALEDALDTAGRPVTEDVADVEENLQDLVTHASEGNEALLDQDIAAIRRNVEAVVSTADGAAERFYQGVVQGLGDCSD